MKATFDIVKYLEHKSIDNVTIYDNAITFLAGDFKFTVYPELMRDDVSGEDFAVLKVKRVII